MMAPHSLGLEAIVCFEYEGASGQLKRALDEAVQIRGDTSLQPNFVTRGIGGGHPISGAKLDAQVADVQRGSAFQMTRSSG